ncbi:MAG TPA: flagellar biosynthesis protein FlhA [Chitinispirillaceae bacterium]|nr:flagellar biosynthesis protein FlhA [Chitinispirillaceae bacterium]
MNSSNLPTAVNNAINAPFFKNLANQRDLIIVLGVIGILVVMIIPIPTLLMDILLSLSLCLAMIILLVSMYTKEALEFSVFPSLLLTITLFRLSLNVATTRLILSKADAGEVVRVFGTFVTSGNMVVGAIIFLIIVIIQFVVITKGAGRIAEVAARFTLDAMPGKQMAIDADLNAGLINEEQARARRSQISREADFYGAMDGASKFVRGDAVAGILITVINIIGGFIIGIAQMGMDFPTALTTYTTLTIGDGLISQIPALMISVGSGILVSRAASQADLGQEITTQLFSRPKVLGVAGAMMILFALVPGFPKIPFIILGVSASVAAYMGSKRQQKAILEKNAVDATPQQKEDRVEDYLHVDPMELEIGYGLIPLVDTKQGGDLLDRITMIRRQLATELGIIIPPIRIRDNIQLKPNEYRMKIRTIIVGKGELMSGAYLAMDPGTAVKKIRGIQTTEPAFGLPALWITESQKEDAEMAGYTVVELPAVLATHLTEMVKSHAHEILSRQDVRTLLDNVKENNATVVDELVPAILNVGDIHKVLQNLLREQVSIRDLLLILETLANVSSRSKNTEILTEYVRNALSAQICEIYKNEESIIPVITLDPNLEAKLEGAVQETESGFRLNLSPGEVGRILDKVGETIEKIKGSGEVPLIICSPTIRSAFKRLCESNYRDLVVLSYNEIVPGIEIRSLGMISL